MLGGLQNPAWTPVAPPYAAWLPTGRRRRRRAGLRPAMPPEAAASDRESSTRSGGTPRGPQIRGPGRLCPACTMAGRRPALRAEAERTRVVVRWLSTTTRVPVGCGHIGFAQAPHPKADRACQPHGRSHLGVGLARRASNSRDAADARGPAEPCLDAGCPSLRGLAPDGLPPSPQGRSSTCHAAGGGSVRPRIVDKERRDAAWSANSWPRTLVPCVYNGRSKTCPTARRRSEPALSCDGSARQRGFPLDAVTSDLLRLRIPRLTGPVSPTAGAISAWGWHAVPAIPGTLPMLGGLQNPA